MINRTDMISKMVATTKCVRTIVQVLTEVRHTVEVLRCLVAESSCHTVLILIEVAELILTKLETQILGVHLGNFCMFEL